jgi:hypothetical protein
MRIKHARKAAGRARDPAMIDLRESTVAGYPSSLWWSASGYCELGRLLILSVEPTHKIEDATAANRRQVVKVANAKHTIKANIVCPKN